MNARAGLALLEAKGHLCAAKPLGAGSFLPPSTAEPSPVGKVTALLTASLRQSQSHPSIADLIILAALCSIIAMI